MACIKIKFIKTKNHQPQRQTKKNNFFSIHFRRLKYRPQFCSNNEDGCTQRMPHFLEEILTYFWYKITKDDDLEEFLFALVSNQSEHSQEKLVVLHRRTDLWEIMALLKESISILISSKYFLRPGKWITFSFIPCKESKWKLGQTRFLFQLIFVNDF